MAVKKQVQTKSKARTRTKTTDAKKPTSRTPRKRTPKLDKIGHHKKELIKALEANLANVSKSCEAVGISRSTFYNYLEDPVFADQVDEVVEGTKDFVESKLFELINGVEIQKEGKDGEPIIYTKPPDNTSIIFFLKTRAKDRGYIEKQEIDFNDVTGLNVEIISGGPQIEEDPTEEDA